MSGCVLNTSGFTSVTQDGYGSYPSNDYGSDLYIADDAEVFIPEEQYTYEDEAREVLQR